MPDIECLDCGEFHPVGECNVPEDYRDAVETIFNRFLHLEYNFERDGYLYRVARSSQPGVLMVSRFNKAGLISGLPAPKPLGGGE